MQLHAPGTKELKLSWMDWADSWGTSKLEMQGRGRVRAWWPGASSRVLFDRDRWLLAKSGRDRLPNCTQPLHVR